MAKSRKSKPTGIKSISHATAVGQRNYQEDRYVMISADEGTILAIMDGHGGENVSMLLEENFRKVWRAVYTPEKPIEQVYKELFEVPLKVASTPMARAIAIVRVRDATTASHTIRSQIPTQSLVFGKCS